MIRDLVLIGHLYTLSGVVGGLLLAVIVRLTARDRTSSREAAQLVMIRLPLVLASSVAFGVVLLTMQAPAAPQAFGAEIPGWIAIVVFLLIGHLALILAARHLEADRPWLWSAGTALLVVIAVGILHSTSPISGSGPALDTTQMVDAFNADAALRLGFLAAVGLTVAGAFLPILATRPRAVHVADLLTSRGALAAIVGVVAQGWIGSRILELQLSSDALGEVDPIGFWAWILAAAVVAVLAGVELAAGRAHPLVVRGLLAATTAATAAAVTLRSGLGEPGIEGAAAKSVAEVLIFVVGALIVGALMAGAQRDER
jgi:hypothetical protein